LVEGTWFVKDLSFVGDIAELKLYFESTDNYVIGDFNTNEMVESNTLVKENMDIVVKKKNKVVVIEVDATTNSDNSSEIVKAISEATGVDADSIIVNFVTDKNGALVRIELFVDTDKDANVIVDMVNNLDRSSTCDAGILCRSKKAYVLTELLELDVTNKLSITVELFLVCYIFLLSFFLNCYKT